jgi:glycosyltransferase involved in cell wall biosynthesis
LVDISCIDGWEIVVVDDGSIDDTAAQVRAMAHAQVRLVVHSENQGYGAALRSGFNAARERYIFFTDADLQFDAAEIALLTPWIDRFDIVVGYRSPRQDPWIRRANAAAWGLALYGAFGLDVEDVNCAFKLFRREVLEGMEINSEGAFVNAEILVKATKGGFRIKQVPVSHFARVAGAQTGAQPKVVLKAFREMARFYRRQRGNPEEGAAF